METSDGVACQLLGLLYMATYIILYVLKCSINAYRHWLLDFFQARAFCIVIKFWQWILNSKSVQWIKPFWLSNHFLKFSTIVPDRIAGNWQILSVDELQRLIDEWWPTNDTYYGSNSNNNKWRLDSMCTWNSNTNQPNCCKLLRGLYL